MVSKPQHEPSPEQIAAACAAIQRTWSPEQRLRRLRADLRPQIMCADGRHEDVDADDYFGHLDEHEILQEEMP